MRASHRLPLLLMACAAAWLGHPSDAAAAPQQLYGKSVIVGWTEERQQKSPGADQVRSVGAFGEFSLYVSEQGRNFSRMRFSLRGPRGGMQTGARDAVGGQARSFNFRGTSLNVAVPRGSGGATQISVTFDAGFQGCTANVVFGKTAGTRRVMSKSLINQMPVEIHSAKTGGESCRVQAGNVFGN